LWIIIKEGLLFNPIAATQRGDNRYNDLLPNDIAAPYLKKQHDFTKYQKLLKAFDSNKLNSFDKIAFDIMSLQLKQANRKGKIPF
jgi:uncharacterized protein (DUF885 family)